MDPCRGEYLWYKGNTNIPWRNEQGEKIMPGKEIKGKSKRAMYSNGKLVGRNKKLAAMYGDKNKVTRGDIITAAKKNKGKA